MKSAVETLGPTRARLTVEVPFEELQSSLDAAYRRIAQQINIPGFRRGKVPPMVIDRQVGRGVVLDEALNEVLPRKYVEAVEENSLQPLAQPEIEVTRFDDREALEFTAEVDVRPAIELPEYTGIEAEVDAVEVTDADVDEQLEAMRERFGTLIDVDRPAADGDFVVMDLAARQHGEPVEGAEVSGMSYSVGRGGMLAGLDEALVGMAAGDRREFVSQLVAGDLVGRDVEVEVAVHQVQQQELPELDDEFAQQASEFDTLVELRADVRDRLGRVRRLEQAAAARDAVLERLLELVTVPLPEALVTEELDARRSSLEQQLAMAGLSTQRYLEDEGQTVEEFEADLERRVRAAVAAQFLLDEIARREELGVNQEELSQHLVRRAQQAGEDPQEYANHIFEHNHVGDMVQEVVRGKALAKVVESAVVTDSRGGRLELASLRPDGSLGAPEDLADDGPESGVEEPQDEPRDA